MVNKTPDDSTENGAAARTDKGGKAIIIDEFHKHFFPPPRRQLTIEDLGELALTEAELNAIKRLNE